MENENKYFNNLEELLQSESNSFKINPKDTTWEDIKNALHDTPKWTALWVTFMFIIISLTISTALNYPPTPILAKYKLLINEKETTKNKKSTDEKFFIDQLNTFVNNQETFAKKTLSDNKNISDSNTTLNSINNDELLVINTIKKRENNSNLILSTSKIAVSNYDIAKVKTNFDPILNLNETASLTTNEMNDVVNEEIGFTGNQETLALKNDGYINEFKVKKNSKVKKPSKWQQQVYITPSISDRILFDDKERIKYISPTSSAAQNLGKDVNDAIRYTPAMGTEIGIGFLYKAAKNLHLKTGLQFNIRQYYIDAYRGFNTATVAFVNNRTLDSVNLLSLFSNNKNSYKAELNNKLYQVSIPIGVQWDFLNTRDFGMNVAATIQPTFTLNKNTYLVSTDYKYFADGESFFRNLNINSALELNFTLKTGRKNWFFGPQIRYQHLSTFSKIYPIKEFRLDYGFKIGFTTPL